MLLGKQCTHYHGTKGANEGLSYCAYCGYRLGQQEESGKYPDESIMEFHARRQREADMWKQAAQPSSLN